jgi:hypothetical protein
MRKLVRDNSLTLVLLAAFLLSLAGQLLTGWSAENQLLAQHGRAALALWEYARSGAFLSAVFENWESEFLQMAAYVVLTAMLFQRGSPESRDPDEPDQEPRRGPGESILAWLYAYSLGIALAMLFALSFVLHWLGSARAAAEEAMAHGLPLPTLLGHLADPQFWFESFQNWQSEFLSVAVLVVLSIVLRFRGSPESKPVDAPHAQTGR